jgi:hypothetical protein
MTILSASSYTICNSGPNSLGLYPGHYSILATVALANLSTLSMEFIGIHFLNSELGPSMGFKDG